MQRSRKETGSAAVDFVLTVIPLMMVFVSVVTISASSYILSVIRDSAVEGARFAALADQSSVSGCQKARELIEQTLSTSLNPKVDCRLVQINSTNFESVQIEVSLPLANSLLRANTLKAEGWAPREER